MYKTIVNGILTCKDIQEVNDLLTKGNYKTEIKAKLILKAARKGHHLYYELLNEGLCLLKNVDKPNLYIELMKAVTYEKMELFDNAVLTYNNCLQRLPVSAWYHAINAMKYRSYMKKYCDISNEKIKYGLRSCEEFKLARKTEKSDYLLKKWKEAELEVRRCINEA